MSESFESFVNVFVLKRENKRVMEKMLSKAKLNDFIFSILMSSLYIGGHESHHSFTLY
jgi:hypothetical protein